MPMSKQRNTVVPLRGLIRSQNNSKTERNRSAERGALRHLRSMFFIKTADIALKFVKNEQEKVDMLMMEFMRTKMKGRRIHASREI